MANITRNDVVAIYQKLIELSTKAFGKNKIDIACKYIKAAANWCYNFNFIYKSDELEELVKSIGEEYLETRTIKNDTERFVLIDTCGADDHGLHQQYLRSFIANKVPFLFITLRHDITPLNKTLKEINQSEYGKIWYNRNCLKSIELSKEVSDTIYEFAPSRIFMHIMPFDIISLMAVNSIVGPIKYNINLTDHAFWLGVRFINYNIEFRSYGYKVSLEKRGFKASQLLCLPFYPIVQNDIETGKLPTRNTSDIIVFTGGSPNKMMGENDFFFTTILDGILDINDNIIVWIAGFPNKSSLLSKELSKMKNGDRVINIGIRNDINYVFKQCDLYLGTYPIAGGLMSQYAAINGKPLLCFSKYEATKMDGLVNHFSNTHKTYTDIKEFLKFANDLVCNKELRSEIGDCLKSSMMTKSKFDNLFLKVIMRRFDVFNWNLPTVDYEVFFSYYLNTENNYHFGMVNLLEELKWYSINVIGGCMLVSCVSAWRLIKKHIFN
jgi:hypothetical protein